MSGGSSFYDYGRMKPGPDPAQVGAMLQQQPMGQGPQSMAEPMEPMDADDGLMAAAPAPTMDFDDPSVEHSPLSTATALEEAINRAMRGPSRPQETRQRGAYSAQQLAALLPETERRFLETPQ